MDYCSGKIKKGKGCYLRLFIKFKSVWEKIVLDTNRSVFYRDPTLLTKSVQV